MWPWRLMQCVKMASNLQYRLMNNIVAEIQFNSRRIYCKHDCFQSSMGLIFATFGYFSDDQRDGVDCSRERLALLCPIAFCVIGLLLLFWGTKKFGPGLWGKQSAFFRRQMVSSDN